MIAVHTIQDIMDIRNTRETHDAHPFLGLLEYVPSEWRDKETLRVIINGEALSRDEAAERIAADGDDVSCYLLPALEAILISLLVSLIVAGIAYGIRALLAPSRHAPEKQLEDSPTYGFDGIVNTVTPGTRIPLIYGMHRFGGHIIQQFVQPQRDLPNAPADVTAGELHTLLGICSGPIYSIEDAKIDGAPWSDYGVPPPEIRLGGAFQSVIPGFEKVVVQRGKDAVLTQVGGSLIFDTVDDVDSFQITFRFPGGLYKVSSSAGFKKRSVSILIEHRIVGPFGFGGWIKTGTKTLNEAISNSFDAWFDSPELERAQYQIRITRISEDLNKANGFDEVHVLSINNVIDELLTYPGIALAAVRQLPSNRVQGSIPTYSFLVRGRVVRVFTDLTTYTTQWSDNPAWCLLDYLTSREGLGAWINDRRVDLQSFLDWAAFCNTPVAVNEMGELEPQFRVDMVIDGTIPAIDVIKQFCTVGRAYFLLRGDKWAIRPDKPEPPAQGFTMGRIQKGQFAVSKTSKEDIANYLIGQFWNQDLDYESDQLPREDPSLLEGEDQREQTVNLMGVTRASQAQRLLNFLMLDNRLCRRKIEIEVGVEAIGIEAADIFSIAHDVPAWSGLSGKVRDVDSTGTQITLDRDVTIEGGKSYELTVLHASDQYDVVAVTNNPGITRVLTVSGDWSDNPDTGIIQIPVIGVDYAFGEVTKSMALYRVTSITQGSAPWKRTIRAREYNPEIYGSDLTVLPEPVTSKLPDPFSLPPDVQNLRLRERQIYEQDGTLTEALDVFFSLPVVLGVRAQVFWRESGPDSLDDSWSAAGGPSDLGFITIRDDIQTPGVTYEVSVVTVATSGNRKRPEQGVRASITTAGVTRQPGKVSGFRVDRTVTGLIFSWDPLDPVANFDLDLYELRSGTQWETAITLGQTKDTTFSTASVASGAQTFLIKARNTVGRESFEPAAIVIDVTGRVGENVVLTREEAPSWSGIKQNLVVSGTDLLMDTQADVVAWRARLQTTLTGSGLRPGGFGASFLSTASYATAIFSITSGNAVRMFVSTLLDASQIDVSQYWTAAGLAGESWTSDYGKNRAWAAAPEGRVKIKVEMRFSTGTSAEADFGPWQERSAAIEVTAKWAQARISIEVLDAAFTVRLKSFILSFDVPDIVDSGAATTSSSSTVAVTFGKTYNNAPKVTPTVLGATAGDEVFYSTVTNVGFTLEVKNAGARVVRTVHWISVGF
jgi:predicted phage tail protein